jgi:PIN domain nuclease of toxin-antitoxin system
VRLLLDTHALIWCVSAPHRLTAAARAAVTNPANAIFVSAATPWEMAIKQALGRLEFPLDSFEDEMAVAGFAPLPITAAHGIAAGRLPRHHADPFDRMLIAQALAEGLTLVSEDAIFSRYGVALLPPA